MINLTTFYNYSFAMSAFCFLLFLRALKLSKNPKSDPWHFFHFFGKTIVLPAEYLSRRWVRDKNGLSKGISFNDWVRDRNNFLNPNYRGTMIYMGILGFLFLCVGLYSLFIA